MNSENSLTYRVVDLSPVLIPGKEDRRLEIRPWRYDDNSLMHDIDIMSHIGAHVEVPSHWFEGGKDVVEMTIDTFLGEGLVIKLECVDQKDFITQRNFKEACKSRIRKGDIVFATCSLEEGMEPRIISDEAAQWLVDQGVKMFGFDNTMRTYGDTTHEIFLRNDIPMVERLTNLDQVANGRVFLMALPLSIKGLESSPLRAVALEWV